MSCPKGRELGCVYHQLLAAVTLETELHTSPTHLMLGQSGQRQTSEKELQKLAVGSHAGVSKHGKCKTDVGEAAGSFY